VVASNKALTSLIGASSDSNYGPAYGANVVFPKQLMLTAVVDALRGGRTANMADRSKVEAELESAMAGATMKGWAGTSSTPPTGLIPAYVARSRTPLPVCPRRRADLRRRTHVFS